MVLRATLSAGPARVRIRVGHSPDPDDAFMVWALHEGRVDTGGLEFETVPADIQTLNEWALEGRLEATAISCGAYPQLQDRYALLRHGASLGAGYGPVVVAPAELSLAELRSVEIAVPGTMTTAFLVLRLALGADVRRREVPFERIPDEVLGGGAQAGLLIHEGQLTYREVGLRKCLDLGEWWLEETGLPLPLGATAVRRDLGPETSRAVSRVLLESIRAGLAHRDEALAYARRFGRGLDDALTDRFVGMYVNELTRDLGDDGRRALEELFARAERAGLVPAPVRVDFV